MGEPLSVTQLNTLVRNVLNSNPGLCDIWVNGEVSNLKRASSGHYYFTLKDSGAEISCAMFAGARSRIDFEPKENMKVSVFGKVDIYVQRGNYQFIVQTMRQSGIGDLYQQFEKLKRKLQDEGLFDRSRKRHIPQYPRTIGVVTSETGAVIHDIITTSSSRYPADILLAPAQVQGEGAARTIVAGIELLNRVGVDVIIVGRGGGSLEDLWPFNEEVVARAIAASGVPIVSAVGHETDFTISDMVADARAPTPTGAAALILREKAEIRAEVDRTMSGADRALGAVIERMRGRFEVLDARLSPEYAARDLDMKGMHLDGLKNRSDQALTRALADMGSRFALADARLSPASAMRDIELKRSNVESVSARAVAGSSAIVDRDASSLSELSARLSALNPLRVMERGYGIVVRPDGSAVTSVSGMLVGERIEIRLRDGTAKASVREIEEARK